VELVHLQIYKASTCPSPHGSLKLAQQLLEIDFKEGKSFSTKTPSRSSAPGNRCNLQQAFSYHTQKRAKTDATINL